MTPPKVMETVKQIESKEALTFLMPRHYAGRKPQITVAFGLYLGAELVAVCTFGKPASRPLCVGVCGKENAPYVYELNRLCRVDHYTGQLSSFVATCLRRLKQKNWILVSYADTEMRHHGYIYQATNWLYTGQTKSRTDKFTEGNKHPRHYNKLDQSSLRKVRSSKHRYVTFCTHSTKLKTSWNKALNYPIIPYPKGDNSQYTLGETLKPQLVLGAPAE